MAKRRVTRKELVKEPDEFITLTGKVIQWARDNVKPLIYGACAFLGLVIIVSGYRYYSSQQANAAAALFSKALMEYQAADKNGDPDKALAVARPDFERLINKYGGADEGRLGQILYGHLLMNGHAYDEAIRVYQESLGDFNGSPALRNTILNGLATAFMDKGDNTAAIDHFEKIVDGESTLLKDNALFNLALLYRMTGEKEKSQKAYSQLAADFPDSMFADIARENAAG